MSIKDKFFAAVAALMIVGGLGAAAAPTVSAATPSCGKNCINLFAQLYGSSYVLDVLLNQGQNADQPNVGQPLILAPASNSNPGEDFVASEQGTVSDFILAGLVSPDLSAYDNDEAFEFEYAPFGAETGLCMGVGNTPANNTPVSLQPCGVSAKTVWILDQPITNQPFSSTHLINGATDTSFSNPYSLTDLKPGGDQQLFTWPLQGGGILHNKFANQVWGATFGVLP
jgi:hypothetical protein